MASVTWRDLVAWTRPSYLSACAAYQKMRASEASTSAFAALAPCPIDLRRRCEFRGAGGEVLRDVVEHLRAVVRRGRGPAGGLGRGLHRVADVLAVAEAGLADGLALCSVDGIGIAGIGPRLLAADIELGGAVDGRQASTALGRQRAERGWLRRRAPASARPPRRAPDIHTCLRARPRGRSPTRGSRRSPRRHRRGWWS